MTGGRRSARALAVATSTLLVLGTACVPGSDDDVVSESGEVSSESIEAGAAESTAPTGSTESTSTTTTSSSEETETSGSVADVEPVGYIASFDPNDGSDLYRLVGENAEPVSALVAAGNPVQLTDLAMSAGGVLYGSTFEELVRIDDRSGEVALVAPFTQGPVNALTFLADGRLLAADLEGRVSIVDVETGATETVATYPAGLVSSGDLAEAPDGTVYATATDVASDAVSGARVDYLLRIDVDAGAVETQSALLPPAVYGLVVGDDGELLGLTFESASGDCGRGEIIALSADGPDHRLLGCLDFNPGGATGL